MAIKEEPCVLWEKFSIDSVSAAYPLNHLLKRYLPRWTAGLHFCAQSCRSMPQMSDVQRAVLSCLLCSGSCIGLDDSRPDGRTKSKKAGTFAFHLPSHALPLLNKIYTMSAIFIHQINKLKAGKHPVYFVFQLVYQPC